MSNAVFTITPATPIVLTPNGGEVLQSQCNYNITWNAATYYSTVRIDYSLNNGTTWINYVTSTSNDGIQSWAVPNTPSTQCLVKVSNTADLLVNDVSNAVFTIAQPVTVTAANGGETWYGCSTYNITWNRTNCAYSWALYYSTNNGTTWNTIISSVLTTAGLTQSYNWLVPNGITSTQCLIKIEDTSYPTTVFDISNANFTINPSNDITVTSPNGAEVWQGLSSQTITWTNLPSASGQYTLQYSTNNGASYTNIITNITGNSYNWTVPNIPSTTCLIKVIDYVNTCKFDVSNAVFTITPATPIVLTPNGGEVLYSGVAYNISWNAATYYSTVRIDYSINNGASWINYLTSTSNDGIQNWTIPNVSSTQCLVKVSNTADVLVNDVSNAVFTIKPAVTIITPNGDNGVTIWGGCTVTSITFDRSPAWNTYQIEYSINNGTTWTIITSSFVTAANPATYNWNIPNTPSTQVLVKVTPVSTAYPDQSDATFTITKPVTIIQPNFGGIMTVGSIYNISWSSDGISNVYDLFYSTTGGSSFTNIITGYVTSTNTYAWTVPATLSTNCKIWVRDNINSCKSDTSDIAFTISNTSAPLTITTPNGISDTLNGCHTKTITWTESPVTGTYDIAYSLNSGTTWINIVTSYATVSGTYNWVVPNTINSNQVLLRVRSTGTPTTFDLTDAYFTIRNGNLVASPTSVSVCSSVPVSLNATGGFNYNWTPSTGLSATNIPNPVATLSASQTYYVQSINGSCILTDTVTINITTSGTTASVAISVSPNDSICTGTPVTYTSVPANGGSAPVYQWKVNGVNVGAGGTTYASSTMNNSDVVTCLMTSNLACVAGSPATSNSIAMSVSPAVTPAVSVSTSPGTTICTGTNVTFTTTPTNGGTTPSYQWQLNGANIGTNSSTFSNSGLANGDIVTVTLTSNANCLTTTSVTSSNITMTVNSVPNQPVSVSGSASVCSGTSNTYSVASVAGATSYTWTLPGGWTGTSATNSINATASTTSGIISVTANNTCGNSAAQTLAVVVNTLPTTPGTISGATAICSGSLNTYSISAVAGATSYTWTLPGGWTGTSTSTNINATAGATSGNVTVTANNACGNSIMQTLAVVSTSIPATPSTIFGSATICDGASDVYSITAVAGATSYTWTLPGGWSGTSTTNSISATAGSTGGTITVTANNACGNSIAQTLVVTVNSGTPATPGTILGTATICEGTTNTYSITAIAGATSYTWTLPGAWTGTSTTNSINATTDATSGNITVTANNGCGISAPQTFAVVVNPSPIVTYTQSPALVCETATSVVLGTSSPAGGTYSGTAVTGSTFNASVAGIGTFSILYSFTDANSCTNSASSNIMVDACLGVDQNAGVNEIVIYPNPTSDVINVIMNGVKLSHITITDVLGKVVYEIDSSLEKTEINLTNFQSGIYFIQIQTEGSTITKKVVKN